MVHRGNLYRFLYRLGGYLSLFTGGAIILVGWISKTKLEYFADWPAIAKTIIAEIQSFTFGIWIALGSLSILGWVFKLRGDAWVWDKIQSLLDATQKLAYRHIPEIRDSHRVTLFKRKKWCWFFKSSMSKGIFPWSKGRYPWSGWLVPVLRSGHTSQKTRAIFLASDDGSKCEGVAGHAWAANNKIVVDNLQNITAASSQANRRRYAERTFCPERLIESYISLARPLPRSIGAIPIEVNHKFWGVLVLDSRSATAVTNELMNELSLMVVSLSQLLEKAK